MTRDRDLKAGLESGVYSKEQLKNVEGKLSKPLSEETAKQGPRAPKSAGEGPYKFK